MFDEIRHKQITIRINPFVKNNVVKFELKKPNVKIGTIVAVMVTKIIFFL